MSLGHTGAAVDTSDDHVSTLAFKEYVEKASKGDIEVKLFPAQQLGNAREMAEQISSGVLDSANIPIVFLSSFIPELSIVEMPYFLEGHEHGKKFLEGGIVDFLSAEITKAIPNVAAVKLSNTGNFRSFYTTKPVKSAADMAGIKMRTVPSPRVIEFVSQLGAEPVALGWGEVYPSLQSGLIEGTKNAAADIVPSKMDEVVKHVVLDRHSYLIAGNIISQSFLDGCLMSTVRLLRMASMFLLRPKRTITRTSSKKLRRSL